MTISLVEEVSLSWCGLPLPVLALPKKSPVKERRSGERMPCVLRATITWSSPWPVQPVRVLDVSEGGLGLVVRGRCPSEVEAELELHDRSGRCYAVVWGRVTWTARIAPGIWQAGWEVFPHLDPGDVWIPEAAELVAS